MASRRTILQGGTGLAATLLLGWGARAQAQSFETPLPIPELVDARVANGSVRLVAARGTHAFLPGRPTPTLGLSAPYLGPVVRVHAGDQVEFTVENALDFDTTVHWHGILVPAEVDGGPHLVVKPGTAWRPVLTIDQPESTAWYHAHPHGDTGRQVYMGLAGMMIVEDGTGERLGLPRHYGVDDLPIILQDKQFDGGGNLIYSNFGPSMMMGMRGDTPIVNGVATPYARVPAALVRLRLLNAANARNFDLRFSDGRPFQVIASDGGYLRAPVPLTSLRIAPSERFEVVVDFSDGRAVDLEAPADLPMIGMGAVMGVAGSGGALMRFEVDGSLPGAVTRIPPALVDLGEPDAGKAVRRRRVSLDMGMGGMGRGGMGGMGGMGGFGINGEPFDMGRISFEPELGTSEIWEVTPSMMAHPFHVHGVTFRVLSIGGSPVAPHLAGGKDTILLDQPGELLITFTQPASREFPFMFHCHILEHEDAGMMGQFSTTGGPRITIA
jgi:blue copper oxidase